MKTLFIDGNTFLHRLSPRIKLIGLAVVSLLLFLIHRPEPLFLFLLAATALYGNLRMGWRQSWLRVRVLLITIIAVSLFTMFFNGTNEAFVVFLRLLTLALFAATVTATTSTGDFIEVVTAAFRPLEWTGLIKAADIGLAIGLVIRFVPEVQSRYEAIRDAHRARGLKVSPLTLAVPLIILTLKQADDIAAAIDARSIRGHK